ncbi:MAG: metallophosphoesterase family protein [Desulfurococcales archaeon]|nr:metallophosphoesterase family protein [Desulfurococcales archaeon]
MRALHVSDAHCNTSTLKAILDSESYDVVLATGDYECLDTVEALLKAPTPIASVTGNMDHASISRRLAEAGVLVDGRVKMVEGLLVGGVSGMDPASSLRSLLDRIGREGVSRIDVLLTHHPPRGVLDLTLAGVRAGLESLRKLSETLSPKLHAFGHIHESPGYEVVGDVAYVNPGPAFEGRYAIIEFKEGIIKISLHRI